MRLIHLTDPHLSTLDDRLFWTLRGKRHSGFQSWTRKRRLVHRREVFAGLCAALNDEAADQLILSGDLVQIGLEQEVREVVPLMRQLAAAGQIFFVPGNHDVYAPDSWSFIRRHWDFLLPAAVPGMPDTSVSAYPVLREIAPRNDAANMVLIGASSACVTPLFSARGALGTAQLARLETQLQEARATRRLVCLAVHHPPLPGMTGWRKALKETAAMQQMIQRHQPALVLCGHLHRDMERRLGHSRVYCTASASSINNASYRVFNIAATSGGWQMHMQLKALEPASGRFVLKAQDDWHISH